MTPAEAYCCKAFRAYEGKIKADKIPQVEQQQADSAEEITETGPDKNGCETVRIRPEDLVTFYANQHALGIFATMGERVNLAKDFIRTFRPGAAIH